MQQTQTAALQHLTQSWLLSAQPGGGWYEASLGYAKHPVWTQNLLNFYLTVFARKITLISWPKHTHSPTVLSGNLCLYKEEHILTVLAKFLITCHLSNLKKKKGYLMFFLDIITKVTATRQQWYCRPERPCTILFSFHSVHIFIYMHMLENEEVLYLSAKASSVTQLQLTYFREKIHLCTHSPPRLCNTRSHAAQLCQ